MDKYKEFIAEFMEIKKKYKISTISFTKGSEDDPNEFIVSLHLTDDLEYIQRENKKHGINR